MKLETQVQSWKHFSHMETFSKKVDIVEIEFFK